MTEVRSVNVEVQFFFLKFSQVSLYITMLALLLFVAHGKSCRNKYQLTKAIKTQLGRY